MKKILLTLATTIALSTSAQAFETQKVSNAKCKVLETGLSHDNGYSRFHSLTHEHIWIDGDFWVFDYISESKNKVVGIKHYGIYGMGHCEVMIGSIDELSKEIQKKDIERQLRIQKAKETVSNEFGL
tara:strand:+ start:56 stop:436 length:381 start_codon:yes stop_codon:yes gene_type:complete